MDGRLLLFVVLLQIGCQSMTAGVDQSCHVSLDVPEAAAQARVYHQRAVELIGERQWQAAEEAIKHALKLDATFGPAQNNLGRIYMVRNEWYPAALALQRAVALMPDEPEPRFNLGLVFERVGKLNQAIVQFTQAHELSPDRPEFLSSLALVRWRRGDRDPQTVELLRQVIMKDARPSWRQWASRRLGELGHSPSIE